MKRTIALLIGLGLVTAQVGVLGFRFNLTRSLPLGVYRATSAPPTRGSIVQVCLPPRVAEFARGRGFLGPGKCPGRVRPLGKSVLAAEGDVVGLKRDGIHLNGEPVPNSRVLMRDIPGSPAFASGAEREMLPTDRHEAFFEATAEHVEPEPYIAGKLVEPVSEYQLMAGTVLPAMMVTAMNSDLPGEILAQISRDVYDSQQRHVLIPRGTRVLGRYDNQVSLGQSRALVAWTRLIFPDGRSLSLPGLPTKDLQGASGVESEVDNHYMRLYGQGVLLSIIGAAAQLSQPQQSSAFAPPSPGQIAAGEIGRQLSQISMETIRRNMDIRPTLKIEAATAFYIFLARDLVLEGAYADRRALARHRAANRSRR